ncbi:MAG: hypothetical protein AAF267_07825 [Deinococcota bacterium]
MTPNKLLIPARTLFALAVIITAFALGLATFVVFQRKPRMQRLQAEGTTYDAGIIFKSTDTYSCGRSTCTAYVLHVMFYLPAEPQTETFEFALGLSIDLPIASFGEMRSAEIDVPRRVYRRVQAGDDVDILHHPAQLDADIPEEIVFAETALNWNTWGGGLGFSVLLGLLAGCFFAGYWGLKRQVETLWQQLQTAQQVEGSS